MNISLKKTFRPKRELEQKYSKSGTFHFINHHSLTKLLELNINLDNEQNNCLVDGFFLSLILRILRIEHLYYPGPDFLDKEILKNKKESLSFIVGSQPAFKRLKDLGHKKVFNVPMIDRSNINQVIEKLNFTDNETIVVGIGSPNQDLLATNLIKKNKNLKIFCLGAAVDFYTNVQSRPPLLFRKIKMEWLWRLITNFRVTLPRISSSTFKFIKMIFLKRFRF